MLTKDCTGTNHYLAGLSHEFIGDSWWLELLVVGWWMSDPVCENKRSHAHDSSTHHNTVSLQWMSALVGCGQPTKRALRKALRGHWATMDHPTRDVPTWCLWSCPKASGHPAECRAPSRRAPSTSVTQIWQRVELQPRGGFFPQVPQGCLVRFFFRLWFIVQVIQVHHLHEYKYTIYGIWSSSATEYCWIDGGKEKKHYPIFWHCSKPESVQTLSPFPEIRQVSHSQFALRPQGHNDASSGATSKPPTSTCPTLLHTTKYDTNIYKQHVVMTFFW